VRGGVARPRHEDGLLCRGSKLLLEYLHPISIGASAILVYQN
jgi:hypothetical protein